MTRYDATKHNRPQLICVVVAADHDRDHPGGVGNAAELDRTRRNRVGQFGSDHEMHLPDLLRDDGGELRDRASSEACPPIIDSNICYSIDVSQPSYATQRDATQSPPKGMAC